MLQYRPKPDKNEKLRERIRRLAEKKRRWGAGQIYLTLRLEGKRVNHKRVWRIYREEKLQLKRRKRRKVPAALRVIYPRPTQVNDCWSMDFVTDALMSGKPVRILTVVDDCSTEALIALPRNSLPAEAVTECLDGIARKRKYPKRIRTDNGPEFWSKHFQSWCLEHNVRHQPIEKGKPYQNAFIESFNGRLREECLSQQLFLTVADAEEKLRNFVDEYNNHRPKRALGGMPPNSYAKALATNHQETLIRSGSK